MGGVLIFKPKFFEKYQKTSSNCSSSDSVYCNEKNPNLNYSSQSNTNTPDSGIDNGNGVTNSPNSGVNSGVNNNINNDNSGFNNNTNNSKININYIFGTGLIILIYMFYKKYDMKFIYILFLILVLLKLSL